MACMERLLSRYLAGAYEQVWEELLSMGEDVRREPWYTEARAVAQETSRRVRHNCELLIPRLEQLGWRFFDAQPELRNPRAPWQRVARLCPPASPVVLNEIERRFGPLPLVLRVFYEVVGGINLIGAPFQRPGWPEIEDGLDPLFIAPVEQAAEMMEEDTSDGSHDPMGHSIFVAPDFLFKYGIGGVGSLSLAISSLAVDAPLIVEDGPLMAYDQPLTLVRYLRYAMQGGGFLAFLDWERAEIPQDDLAFLTAHLLPI
jgi:hypothetical protein